MDTIVAFLMFGGMLAFLVFNMYKGWTIGNDSPLLGKKKVNMSPTRVLLIKTLKRMGCEPEVDEKNENIWFDYQGEHFMVESSNDCLYVNVYDIWWYQVSLEDGVEEFARMQKTVNLINGWANCTVLYSVRQEDGIAGVHLKKNMLYIEQIPELDKYLAGTLEGFFQTQRLFMTELEKLKVQEKVTP